MRCKAPGSRMACRFRRPLCKNSIHRNCTDDSALSNVQALIDALKTPVTRIDSTVYDTLLENANALIAGETTLEQAQTGVENALALYLAEQN